MEIRISKDPIILSLLIGGIALVVSVIIFAIAKPNMVTKVNKKHINSVFVTVFIFMCTIVWLVALTMYTVIKVNKQDASLYELNYHLLRYGIPVMPAIPLQTTKVIYDPNVVTRAMGRRQGSTFVDKATTSATVDAIVLSDTTKHNFRVFGSINPSTYQLPPGNFAVTSGLTVYPGDHWYGAATNETVLILDPSVTTCFKMLPGPASNTGFSNFTVVGAGLKAEQTAILAGCLPNYSGHMHFSNLSIFNCAYGIHSNIDVADAFFDSFLSEVQVDGANIAIELGGSNNHFERCWLTNNTWGIQVSQHTAVSIGGGALYTVLFVANDFDVVYDNTAEVTTPFRPFAMYGCWMEQTKTAHFGVTNNRQFEILSFLMSSTLFDHTVLASGFQENLQNSVAYFERCVFLGGTPVVGSGIIVV